MSLTAAGHSEGAHMNKSDLIAAMADHTNLSKADAGRCLDSFLDIILNQSA